MKPLPYISPWAALFMLFCVASIRTAAQSVSGIINTYHKITTVNNLTGTLTLTSTAGLSPGTKVLVIQMKGATINNSNTSSFGNISALNNAGNYEFNAICGISGNDVLLQSQLINNYDPAGSVQLVTVPVYTTVTVTDTLESSPWNTVTGTGGVVVLEADTIYLNSAINVSGQGFAGGGFLNFPTPTYDCSWFYPVDQYYLGTAPAGTWYSGGLKGEGIADYITNAECARGKQANGGGGGNNHNSGGAGGGNYGAGGSGGTRSNETTFQCHGPNPGIGGLALASSGYTTGNNRIFLGGGGGEGHQNNNVGMAGGPGGGIVIVTADIVYAAGTGILANGSLPVNAALTDPYTAQGDGGSGGGAGGSILLDIDQVSGSLIANATGAKGSDAGRGVNDCPGPGGGGGGGVVWMKGGSGIANVTTNVSGGANGVVSTSSNTAACRGQASGATAGAAGATLNGLTIPLSTPLICAPLPIPQLKSFNAACEASAILLQWRMQSIEGIKAYSIERSADQVHYSSIINQNNNGQYNFTIKDEHPLPGTSFYRLKVVYQNGSAAYSQVVQCKQKVTETVQWLQLAPNPASQQIKLTVLSQKNTTNIIRIYNATGQQISSRQHKLSPGYNTLTIPVQNLSKGLYWLVMETEGERKARSFVKGE